MQINLIGCVFVLDSIKNENIRKNDIKRLKVLVDENRELPKIPVQKSDLKNQIKKNLKKILGTEHFHLEQVYTMDYKDEIDILYLGITNIEFIQSLLEGYQLVDFSLSENHLISLDGKDYEYKTIEMEENNNIEYVHKIQSKDSIAVRTLMNLLISYKRIRSNIDNTDIVFKFMGSSFTLEDVRIVYELVKDSSVDKSNFRKKIIKYCEKVNESTDMKSGYRPSQRYKFKPLKGDVWL